jgi:rod shape-determining protein MreC
VAWIRPVADSFTYILKPLNGKIYPGSAAIQKYLNESKTNSELLQNNDIAQVEIDRLMQENSRLKQEMSDLKLLREEQEFLNQLGYRYLSTHVIGRSTDNFTHTVIIGIGSHEGVAVGQAVIAERGYMIGKVTKVGTTVSQVLLITDSQSQVAAAVQNETSSPGLVVGERGTSIEMQLIPQNEVVTNDQMVITSGLEPTIPRGLLIGKIINTTTPAGEIFQNATITTNPLTEQAGVVSVVINQNNSL